MIIGASNCNLRTLPGRPYRFVVGPGLLLNLATTMLGRRNEKSPFFDFLKVDCGRGPREVFGRAPCIGVDHGLQ